ncbi:ABC transporter ATP-binding protein [Fulvivirga kasyanovii]|uniref:ABC transporter ATP-binding protein n=1 Tax=Fulvivirga kasyanovii TaxID=396812 RepID=A0ABW9RWY3_9BACT|nr:ABC transporter ATP-binding protein [Fulvivirga kasyanovii]MTI28764.1 ABC transporter ATP-binding protein [Fulvivirga kasyanovii]
MIEVRNITKSYHSTPVVSNLSFSVAPGEVLVLLGPSGSGKTTTLKIINRLIEKDSGKIFIESEDTDKLTPYELRRKIGYVIQSIGLFPHYTIEQNISIVPELLGWNKTRIQNRVDSLLEMMNLPSSVKSRKPHELSGGQQQRVGIARALAGGPSLILMDEPFGALDPITRQELQKEFKQLEGAINKAIILVTHDIIEAMVLGDKICLLDEGKIQQIGTPKELLFQPANKFVKEFFSQHKLQLELNAVTLQDLSGFISLEGFDLPADLQPEASLAECLMYTDKKASLQYNSLLKIYFNHREVLISKFKESV